LSIPWDEVNDEFLERTEHDDGSANDPYSVFRGSPALPVSAR